MLNFKFSDGTLYIQGQDDVVTFKELRAALKEIQKAAAEVKRVEILDGITEIGGQCFLFFQKMETISISSSVKVIQDLAFEDCESLQEIDLPDSVIKVGGDAFRNCNKLKKVRLSKNLETIPGSCFENCTSLEDIDIPEGVKTIETFAFQFCSSLKSVVLPDSLENVCMFAFDFCENLTSITVGEKVSDMWLLAMNIGTNLQSLKISEKNPYFTTSSSGNAVYNKDKTELLFILPDVESAYIEDCVKKAAESIMFEDSKLKYLSLPHCFINHDINLPPSVEVTIRD